MKRTIIFIMIITSVMLLGCQKEQVIKNYEDDPIEVVKIETNIETNNDGENENNNKKTDDTVVDIDDIDLESPEEESETSEIIPTKVDKEPTKPTKMDVIKVINSEVLVDVSETINQESSTSDVILSVTDSEGNSLWLREWTDLLLTELNVHSEYVISNNRIYIVVQGWLYCLDKADGRNLFEPVHVGFTIKPVIDDKENIYCTGTLGLLITKVSSSGEIIWQLEDNVNVWWPKTPYIQGDYVYLPFENPEVLLYNVGQINRDTGVFTNFYWQDEGSIIWENVTASSTLENYYLASILDNSLETGWVEGDSGDGIGQWIMFESSEEVIIDKLAIYNGYHKSEKHYKTNNRVKTFLVTTSNDEPFLLTIDDEMKLIEIPFDVPIKTNFIKLEIIKVYNGSEFKDTVISGIQLY
jgi:hypothetical protein